LTDLELQHLRLLVEIRDRANDDASRYQESLEDFLLEMRDSGASTRGVEALIGIAHTTIQTWMDKAAKRRQAAG
jgi:hypothetical protein